MLSKAVNGYTAAQVDACIRGDNFPPQYRFRFELYDRSDNFLREITSVELDKSKVSHKADAPIKTIADLTIKEKQRVLSAYQTLTVEQGPLCFWRCGETSGATASDSSGNSRPATINNFSAGDYSRQSLLAGALTNTAFNFDGVNNFLSVAHASWMNVAQITLEMWIQTTAAGVRIISRDDTVSNRAWNIALQAAGDLRFRIFIGSVQKELSTGVSVNDGNPHYIVCTYDGSYMRAYVDGLMVAQFAQTGSIDSVTQAIAVGAVSGGGGSFFNGQIDEVALYGRALSPSEIRDKYQAGANRLDEILYDTGDKLKVYVGVGMVMEPDYEDDADWAEWPVIYCLLRSVRRRTSGTGLVREVTAPDQAAQLIDDRFSSRWTVASGVNYISGANGVLAIAQSAGFNTTGWAVTSTTSVLPTAIDFEIGTSKLDGINYLLEALNYKKLRFKGDGNAVIEPKVLPATREPEDTFSVDANSVLSADEIAEEVSVDEVYNEVTLYKNNPDGSTLVSTQTNTSLSSRVSVPVLGRKRVYTEQVEVDNQTTLDSRAKSRLTELSQVSKRVPLKTLIRPFHDDEDIYRLEHTDIENALAISANFIETEWVLHFDVDKLMEHTLQLVPNVTS